MTEQWWCKCLQNWTCRLSNNSTRSRPVFRSWTLYSRGIWRL